MDNKPLMELVADYALAKGFEGLNKLPGCWEQQVNEHWWIALNAHSEPIKNSKGVEVDPFHCYVEFNGWPAGFFDAFGGSFAAGSMANEKAFASVLRDEIGKLTQKVSQ